MKKTTFITAHSVHRHLPTLCLHFVAYVWKHVRGLSAGPKGRQGLLQLIEEFAHFKGCSVT